jgi:tRNA(Ile)-lysidine synthase
MARVLIKKIEDTIIRHRMLRKNEMVLIAFSGGPDSMVLLDALDKLKSKYGIRLCLAHFNHRLRGKAAEEDAEFAEKTANERKLMFIGSSADVAAYAKENKLSIEAAGRKLRYEFFLRSSLTVGASKVALGHTADDQAETLLMRLIRGAGPGGLAGIPPIRRLDERSGLKIIRPLITSWRSEIEQYLGERQLDSRRDVSNEQPEYFRNRIRLELIPHLEKEYNPQIKQHFAAAASALAIENDFLSGEAELLAGETLIERRQEWVVFDARMLTRLHPALRPRIFSKLLKMARPQASMLETIHFMEADALLAAGGKMHLPGGLSLEVSEGAGLISSSSAESARKRKSFLVDLSGVRAIPELNLAVKTVLMRKISAPSRLIRLCTPSRQYFNLKAVREPLEIRTRRPGDSFSPLGMSGSKKLKDFFIDKKVPRFLRDYIPLLVSDGRIMWVMGYAIDKRFMLKSNSTSALRVDYERAPSGTLPEKRPNR